MARNHLSGPPHDCSDKVLIPNIPGHCYLQHMPDKVPLLKSASICDKD